MLPVVHSLDDLTGKFYGVHVLDFLHFSVGILVPVYLLQILLSKIDYTVLTGILRIVEIALYLSCTVRYREG